MHVSRELTCLLSTCDRITSADVALCVLSTEDIIQDTGDIELPPDFAYLIPQENTYLLLNKSDLVPGRAEIDLASMPHNLKIGGMWLVSLKTRNGVQEFVNDFGHALKGRQVNQ